MTQILTFLELNKQSLRLGKNTYFMMLEKQVSLRWVVVEKYKNEDVTYKARLVARGFEENNLDEICKDSPTRCKENFQVLYYNL